MKDGKGPKYLTLPPGLDRVTWLVGWLVGRLVDLRVRGFLNKTLGCGVTLAQNGSRAGRWQFCYHAEVKAFRPLLLHVKDCHRRGDCYVRREGSWTIVKDPMPGALE